MPSGRAQRTATAGSVSAHGNVRFPDHNSRYHGEHQERSPRNCHRQSEQTGIFTDQDFPPEIEKAVSDFSLGITTETINGFLRWESVRARTDQSDAARIREQISNIDYALFNTTLKENIRVYTGISGEQAKRVRNDSVFSENGYAFASYDPSVVYHRLANSGRDKEGYLTMCVIDFRKGDHPPVCQRYGAGIPHTPWGCLGFCKGGYVR